MAITQESYGTLSDGREVDRYILTHASGISCKIITYGGIVTELHVPDRDGNLDDVVLGLASLADYEKGHPYFGAITGRVAGRITAGTFELDGQKFSLPLNQPPNHLHGGEVGLDKRVWQARTQETESGEPVLELNYLSPDGEEGYPGNVQILVRYCLSDDLALKIDYEATTDAATPLSITNHSYFNLAGEGHPTIADHTLHILTEQAIRGDEDCTLSGEVTSIVGSPDDFTSPTPLADFIAPPTHRHGENYYFPEGKDGSLRHAATLADPGTGRRMEVWTTETSLQMYTARFLGEDNLTGKRGQPYPQHAAICLECHGYPDAVNVPGIDDIILRPDHTYRQTTEYRFSA